MPERKPSSGTILDFRLRILDITHVTTQVHGSSVHGSRLKRDED